MTEILPFPDKKYKVILADPPWSYNDKALAGKRGAGCKYEVQDLEWIKNLPVKDIADDDCVLFLWVTMPQLPNAFEVIESWGFTYKTCAFNWVKKNKKKDSLFMGMGNWSRSNSELCLLATKGKPQRVSASVHSVVITPIERHSQKPDEVRKRIVDLCGDVPRIELFARDVAEGWSGWGNEYPATEPESVTEEKAVDQKVVDNLRKSVDSYVFDPIIDDFLCIDDLLFKDRCPRVYGPGNDNYGRDRDHAEKLIETLANIANMRKELDTAPEVPQEVNTEEWRTINEILDSDTNEPIEVRNNANGTIDIKSGNKLFSGCYVTGKNSQEFNEIEPNNVYTYIATWYGDVKK